MKLLTSVLTLALLFNPLGVGAQSAGTNQGPEGTDASDDAPLQEEPRSLDGVEPPVGYVIGADDVLGVLFWREPSMSGDVTVRPDGRITLPLLNEVQAAGHTPAELREVLTAEASRYLETPNVTIVVREINSRNVFITGEVGQPGNYPLSASMTVMQLIAMAGGLREYADSGKIVIMRPGENGETIYRFNYKHVLEGKNIRQNIQLKPGDTVVVP